jgi:hypothetical protein
MIIVIEMLLEIIVNIIVLLDSIGDENSVRRKIIMKANVFKIIFILILVLTRFHDKVIHVIKGTKGP